MAERLRFDEGGMRELLESRTGPVAKELVRRTVRIERTAKRTAPVDTGRLRASVTRSLERDEAGLVGVVGTDVEYARRIELGFEGPDALGRTYHQPARPFLRSALAAELGRGDT